jgi:tetratricopeptide (TPR) repeat protein
MTQNAPGQTQHSAQLTLTGGAAILAPITAFPNGVPSNALVLIPIAPNGQPMEKKITEGPVALQMDEVWKLLGFNGPAVQVQDEQGRPIMIGLDDLLAGLDKHWVENPDDIERGKIYAQKLMEHERHAKAEQVLAKLVAMGGGGDLWLMLGAAQAAQEKWEKAEGTLKGAQNLLKDNPMPSIELAKVMRGKKDKKAEREHLDRALSIAPNFVDGWAQLFLFIKNDKSEDAAIKEIEEMANAPVNAKTAAPYIAIQGFFAGDDKTRDRAIDFAKKAVQRSPDDPLALLCLSALYGQAGKIEEVVKMLAPHEAKMQRDVRLAHNYFEALFALRDMQKITALLNKLATAPSREVKEFAIVRSRAIAQMLDQQKQALAAAGGAAQQSPIIK